MSEVGQKADRVVMVERLVQAARESMNEYECEYGLLCAVLLLLLVNGW